MDPQVHHVVVVSDLHLGGRPADEDRKDPGFQMCPPASRRRLARFIHRLAARAEPATGIAPSSVELVINGDFIDFLAEEPFDAFTVDAAVAVEKLRSAIQASDAGCSEGERVFPALAEFVGRGYKLTVLLGNHDIELALPPVRRALLQALTGGHAARVEFIFDGEAYAVGDALIEHGNRYDGWNAVAYGALRAFKSSATRGENLADFSSPPGSRLVMSVMNRLKERYRFIDLLKPENETVVPILSALEPKLAFELRRIAPLWWNMRDLKPAPGRVRQDESYIAAGPAAAPPLLPDAADSPNFEQSRMATQELLEEACAAAGEAMMPAADERVSPADAQIAGGAVDWLASRFSLWRARAARPFNRYRLLARALATQQKAIATTFDLGSKDPPYYIAAERLHREAARVVVFGHTHLPKAITLGGESGRGLYLNTGTWCPTIRLPEAFYKPNPDDLTLEALADFVDDLALNRTDRWTHLQTLCAHLEIGPDGRSHAALREIDAEGRAHVLFEEPA